MQAPSCATSVGDAKSKWPGCLFRGELQRPNPKPHGASEKLLRATWKPGSRQLKGRERDAPQQADGTPRDFDSRCLPPQRSSLPSPHDQRSGWALCRGRAAARAEPAQVQLGAGVSGVLETPSGKEAAEREHPVRELPEGGAAAREPWQWGCGAGYSGPESHTRLTWAPWTARGLSPLLLLKSQKGDIPGRLRRGRRTVLDRLVARAWISLCSCKIHCSSSRPYMSHLTTADRRPVGPLLPDKGRGNTRRLPWPPRPHQAMTSSQCHFNSRSHSVCAFLNPHPGSPAALPFPPFAPRHRVPRQPSGAGASTASYTVPQRPLSGPT